MAQEEYFTKDRPKDFFDDILNRLPTQGRLLDFGCGRGEFLYHAKLRGMDAVGVEILDDFRRHASHTYGVKVFKHLSDLEGRFDIVTLISSLQYMEDPASILSDISDLLNTNGLIYIETTNDDALIFKVLDLIRPFISQDTLPNHKTLYQKSVINSSRLKGILKDLGFDIVSLEIKGLFGGGNLKNPILNIFYKILIFVGGINVIGHLLFCIARKRSQVNFFV